MSEFDLFNELQDRSYCPSTKDATGASTISYSEYKVNLLKKSVTVNVPIRESVNFEQIISATPVLTPSTLKKILRECRGFVVRDGK